MNLAVTLDVFLHATSKPKPNFVSTSNDDTIL